MSEVPSPGSRSIVVLWTILALIGGYLVFKKSRPVQAPAGMLLSNASAEGEPCANKDRCVVVYMAPWCSACKAALPQLVQIRDKWKGSDRNGIKFIVGNSTTERSMEMINRIGENAFLDDGDRYLKRWNVTHFPTFWVLDRGGQVLHTDRAAIDWLNDELRKGG